VNPARNTSKITPVAHPRVDPLPTPPHGTRTEWAETLRAAHRVLKPGGWLVFEARRPEREAWLEWNREDSFSTLEIPGVGVVESWYEVIDVSLPFVTFRGTIVFQHDGTRSRRTRRCAFAAEMRSQRRWRRSASGSTTCETLPTGRVRSTSSWQRDLDNCTKRLVGNSPAPNARSISRSRRGRDASRTARRERVGNSRSGIGSGCAVVQATILDLELRGWPLPNLDLP
jgi:hypothetical protein